jgi:hypothetical protein
MILVQFVLANQVMLAVTGYRSSKGNIHTVDPERAVIRRTRDAMRILEHAHARHPPSLLVSVACPTRHVLLETDRVPDLDRAVVRAGDEKDMIGRDSDAGDRSCVLSEVCNQSSSRLSAGTFVWRIAATNSSPPRNPRRHKRSKLG